MPKTNPPKAPAKLRANLSQRDIARLQLETIMSPDAVRRWGKGESVRETTDERLRRAADKLGIKVNPK